MADSGLGLATEGDRLNVRYRQTGRDYSSVTNTLPPKL
jgi:hypothetical protein